MKNVLVLLPAEAGHKEKLEAAGAGCSFVYSDPDTVTAGQIQAANIILGLPKADMIRASKNLEWLQLASAGTDPYIVPGVLDEKTVLSVWDYFQKNQKKHQLTFNILMAEQWYRSQQEQRV